MSIDNRDQRVDQLLQGIYRLCVNTDDCSSCPFYVTKCTFGEPRPRSWFDEETIEIKAEADPIPVEETETETPLIKAIENAIEEEPEEDDSEGTWIVSTTMGTMGSVFSKYVYICSKCGYKKESVLSLTPMTKCPECEKRKAMRAAN